MQLPSKSTLTMVKGTLPRKFFWGSVPELVPIALRNLACDMKYDLNGTNGKQLYCYKVGDLP